MFPYLFGPYGPAVENADELCCVGLVLLLVLVGLLATMAGCLGRVCRRNRRIGPGGVWLNLLPLFNLVWLPVTVERVGESLRAELTDRGRDRPGEGYGKTTGLTALVLYSPAFFLPAAGIVTWPFALIYTVVYWVQIARYAGRLRDEAPRYTPPADEGW
ncbi:MAG: hypothetical protein K2X87_07140 [Gemmataceae bacterium]|nr:hypothetical protein [Gemmataceae bacterium]